MRRQRGRASSDAVAVWNGRSGTDTAAAVAGLRSRVGQRVGNAGWLVGHDGDPPVAVVGDRGAGGATDADEDPAAVGTDGTDGAGTVGLASLAAGGNGPGGVLDRPGSHSGCSRSSRSR